jgi:hypothetical protein
MLAARVSARAGCGKPARPVRRGERSVNRYLSYSTLVCGTDQALAPYRDSKGPFIVDNLDATREELIRLGATITRDQFQAETGSVFFARHPDGTEVEYVQWKPDLVKRLISH